MINRHAHKNRVSFQFSRSLTVAMKINQVEFIYCEKRLFNCTLLGHAQMQGYSIKPLINEELTIFINNIQNLTNNKLTN